MVRTTLTNNELERTGCAAGFDFGRKRYPAVPPEPFGVQMECAAHLIAVGRTIPLNQVVTACRSFVFLSSRLQPFSCLLVPHQLFPLLPHLSYHPTHLLCLPPTQITSLKSGPLKACNCNSTSRHHPSSSSRRQP